MKSLFILMLFCMGIKLIGEAIETRTYSTDTLEIDDGTKDVSLVPSNMLLLRDLDHLTTEESIYSAISPYYGVHRVLLIRDKLTKLSCSFAFIEFVDIQVNFGI
jgi:hypothetical protein